MREFIVKSKNWKVTWLVIWIVMFLAVILAYPSSPSVWFGWLPSSVFVTFGLMVVSFILGWIFCRQRFELGRES